jgi:hypothetical protein
MNAEIVDLTRLLFPDPRCGCTRHMFEAAIDRAQVTLSRSYSSRVIGAAEFDVVLADFKRTLEVVLTAPRHDAGR